MNIRVPSINQQYEYPKQPKGTYAQDIANALPVAVSRYAGYIRNAAALTGAPSQAILAFMVVENLQLIPTLKSGPGAIGLMQVTPSSAAYAINRQSKYFDAKEKAFVKRFVPNAWEPDGDIKSETALKSIVGAKLTIPEFNIYVGALLLSMYLAESEKKYGEFRMDHAIIKYNSGIGTFAKLVTNTGMGSKDTTTLVKNLPLAETKMYIIKVLGVNGSLHQVVKKRLI